MTTGSESLVFDPYDYQVHEDPYPLYARLRDEAPVYRNDDRDFFALSHHGDVLDAFRDSTRFSNSYGVTLDELAWGPDAWRAMSFLAMDSPQHGRMRGLVSRGFTPRRVAEMEPRIRELAVEYLDQVIEAGSFDFVADFAGKLPMDVISEMVGVPVADRAEVRRLADLTVHREEGVIGIPEAGIVAAIELAAYYTEMVAERRKHPTDDLTSALVEVEVDGDRLSDEEIIGFLTLMIVAGNETTTKLLGHAWYWAWRNPDQRRIVQDDPGTILGWIEETLRYDTSSQMLARLATEDVALHGSVIPAGSRVLLLAGSANRDPQAFEQPEEYRVLRFGRDGAESRGAIASFGVGRHFCMGAALARLEAQIALEELLARVQTWDVDQDGCRRVHSVNVRGFAALPTTVTSR
jgi:cytochrome P450